MISTRRSTDFRDKLRRRPQGTRLTLRTSKACSATHLCRNDRGQSQRSSYKKACTRYFCADRPLLCAH